MQQRLPLVLSATAVAVVLLGSTPLGEAARDLAASVPPFAKQAGYAKQAGFAKNAGAVAGIKAARTPTADFLVPLGADGKFPASVGVAGPKGDAGAQGSPGLSELELVTAQSVNDNTAGLKTATASCPAGKKVVGGGAQIQSSPVFPITQSSPLPDLSGWKAQGYAGGSGAFWAVVVYALCAKVAA